jgi:hypothetical protein
MPAQVMLGVDELGIPKVFHGPTRSMLQNGVFSPAAVNALLRAPGVEGDLAGLGEELVRGGLPGACTETEGIWPDSQGVPKIS